MYVNFKFLSGNNFLILLLLVFIGDISQKERIQRAYSREKANPAMLASSKDVDCWKNEFQCSSHYHN